MDSRFLKSSGIEAFTGNELILKGALEAGVHLVTGYPGSPVADVFEVASKISDYLKERGILAQIANNEALAAARLNGARQAGLKAMAVMKSVGFNVAADGLFTGNMARQGKKGAGVVVVGDDPWNDSTQVPQDSRRLAVHLMMPVLEPSTFQEIKDFVRAAFDLSEMSGLHVSVILSTNLADGGGLVQVAGHPAMQVSTLNEQLLDSSSIKAADHVLLPPQTSKLEKEAYEVKLPAALRAARTLKLNRIDPGQKGVRLGFVAAGLPYAYLIEMLRECGMEGQFPILKFGMPYPLEKNIALEFAQGLDEIIVIENKRSFIEEKLRDLLVQAKQHGDLKDLPLIWGKDFPDGLLGVPAEHGVNPSVLLKRLGPLFEKRGMFTGKGRARLAEILQLSSQTLDIPSRTASFCSGCPHRDSTSVFLELMKDFRDPAFMKKNHKREPVDLIFHGDAGCYSMLFMPPNEGLMQNYSGMGLGGGTAMGMDPFIKNKSITFLGDGTFFHSGLAACSDAVKNRADLLFVVLDNKTTAMTGHQPHPGAEVDIMGEKTFGQDVEKALAGIVGDSGVPVIRVNPEKREEYRQALEDLILMDGPKFIIADKECGITYHRRLRRERSTIEHDLGFLPVEKRINVNEDACEYCLECTNKTGCPGLNFVETLHGPKVQTDLSGCVSDGACLRVKACPAFEEVTLRRAAPQASKPMPRPDELSEPAPCALPADGWRAYLAGIGGMGIGSATAVLVRAAQKEGHYVQFCDKKGIAIRNGGVFSHVTILKESRVASPVLSYGTADLLLGLDLLEAVRGLDARVNMRVASPLRTAVVANTAKNPTIRALQGRDDFQPAELIETLKSHTQADEFWGEEISRISQEWLGHTIYDNAMLLGAAFQRGLLPLSLESMQTGISENFRGEARKKSLMAFLLGRDLVVHPERYRREKPQSLAAFMDEKEGRLRGTHGSRTASRFRAALDSAFLKLKLEEEDRLVLVHRFYELIHYENLAFAMDYLSRVLELARRDDRAQGFAATRAAIRSLYKVMAIKDEVWVSHLLTAPEKYERDAKRFGIDLSRGDRIEYVHLNRPAFEVFGLKLEFNLRGRDWMLRIMRHGKFLRRLLPSWHAREKDFRDWFLSLASNFNGEASHYAKWVELLSLPEQVRGYREVRYPKMEVAKARASEIMAGLSGDTRQGAKLKV